MCNCSKHQGAHLDCCRFSQMVRDVAVSRSAIGLLQNLLLNSQLDQIDGDSVSGLALLLESPHQRLGLAIDSLDEIHSAHGPDALPPPTDPPA
jgi:hypothetical protein